MFEDGLDVLEKALDKIVAARVPRLDKAVDDVYDELQDRDEAHEVLFVQVKDELYELRDALDELQAACEAHERRMRIPVIPATQSGAKLPPNPKEACHPIRTKAAPHRSPIGAQRRLG